MVKPIFKYQGGKRKEWKYIEKYIPETTKRIVEPFVGGGAVSWLSEKPALVSDYSEELILVYNTLKEYHRFLTVKHVSDTFEPDEELYYKNREFLNKKDYSNPIVFTLAWLYVRQQCYSGLIRYNKKGEFNTPWGRYKRFSLNLTEEHHDLLQNWEIIHGDFRNTLDMVKEDDFIFLDPPYFNRNSCYKDRQTEDSKLHIDLAEKLLDTDIPWLLIHVDCELYRDLYPENMIKNKDFNYSMQFRDYNMKDNKVNHLYISNV